MRILCADSNHEILHQTLRAASLECDLFWDKTPEELISILPSYDGLVIRSRFKLSRQVLATCPNLKVIGRVGAGMENIDVAFARQQGTVCLCVPEGNRDAVGEHTLGMLLMLLNKLKKADAEVRNGIWLRAENRGTEIKGKTVGLIGYGNMGSAFAKKLMGFECEVFAYDKYKRGFASDLVTEATMGDLFEHCDIVSLHIPLTPETKNMVNSDFLSSFKKNIWLINTARGQCLNTADLVAAMKSGKVSGACLDVLEYESLSFENFDQTPPPLKYLLDSDRVILSPHIAGWTHESNYKMSLGIAEKMIEVFKKSGQKS